MINYWGFGRGRAYVGLGYAKMLKGAHNVYVLQQGTNPIGKEFEGWARVTPYQNYYIDKNVYKTWIRENKLNAVILFEYGQWQEEITDLVKIAKDEGCKVYGFFVIEKFNRKQLAGFDRVFAPCVTCERVFRYNKVRNFTYIPQSIDLTEFDNVKEPTEKFTFLHVGGFGGVHNRKNTQSVIDAFCKLNNPQTKLIISAQQNFPLKIPENHDIELISKNLPREELVKLYHRADAAVYPSKWETIGIPILESLAASLPVITVNAAPMNEFVKVGMNGFIASCDMREYPDIAINAAEVDVDSLKNCMENILNKSIYEMLSRNSRFIVEKLYDLEKNKHYLLDFIEKDLGESK